MALIACAECSKEISDKALSCPHCGAPQAAPAAFQASTTVPVDSKKTGSSWLRWLIGVPVGGFVILMIVGSCAGGSPEGQARASARDAIELCWTEQSKKSLDPGAARFVAGACEKMEADYRTKWGRNP